MGRDYLIVAYRGPALSELEIARLVRRVKPLADLYRHAPARARPRALADLHCIALYDQVVGSSSRPGGEKLYFPEDKLAELERVAAEPDRPLSWLVQAAWKLARAEIMSDARKPPEPPAPKLPEPPDPTFELARLLSRKTPEAFRILQGDHSCVGVYEHFKHGALIDRADFDGEDYMAGPDGRWSSALGVTVTLEKIVARYFPERRGPPLRDADDPAKTIAFDGRRYDFAMDD